MNILSNLGSLACWALPMAVGLAIAVTATASHASVVRYEFHSGPLLLDAVVADTPSDPDFVQAPELEAWTFFLEFDLETMPFDSLRNVSISAYLRGVTRHYSLYITDLDTGIRQHELGALDWFRTDLFDSGILDNLHMTTDDSGEVVDYVVERGHESYEYYARTDRRATFTVCDWCYWPEGEPIWRAEAPVDLRLVSGPLPPEPVPLPAGVILLAGGLGALVALRRRTAKADAA